MKNYKESFLQLIKKPSYILPVIITAILCFGYAATNISVGIDDLEGARYASIWIGEGRFMGTVLNWLFGFAPYHPLHSFVSDCVAILLMIWGTTNLCLLLDRVSDGMIPQKYYVAFACVNLSYPLINEIWEYTNAPLSIGCGLLLISFVLLCMVEALHSKNRMLLIMITCSLLLFAVLSFDESLAQIYVFYVFAILALQCISGKIAKESKFSEMIRQGLLYALPLAVGVVLKYASAFILKTILHTETVRAGATAIKWGEYSSISEGVKQLFAECAAAFPLKGLSYFPLTVFLVALILFALIGLIYALTKKKPILILPGIGMIASLFVITLLQGTFIGYRICLVFSHFIALTVVFLLMLLKKSKKHYLMVGAYCLVVLLCMQQISYLNYLLTANNLRSQEEAFTIRSIGYDLKSEFDMNKPVIFTGSYTLSEEIMATKQAKQGTFGYWAYNRMRQMYEHDTENKNVNLVITNISSVLDWCENAFGDQESMWKLFRFYGVDYTPADYDAVHEEACAYAEANDMPGYPEKGYIEDVGDYIIVNLK